ncbi:MAG: Gfo/Idh/MocA family oxidoreductase, partial [Planctomycetales bacterium]|nr:Gfo/Idh/MocA family oxidoreductase [Planctomycetales bacterium]
AQYSRAADSPSSRVVIGVMGLSRGRSLATSFAKQPNVEVKYVCDVDQNRAASGGQLIEGLGAKAPQVVSDFRRILDDKSVDALVCAAPNHWHAPATILACAAGKHVYVEKPCSHNPREGELMVEAARKHKRAVQMGSQRRSGPGTNEAIQKLREGAIGKVYLVRSWYDNARGSIGVGKPADVPSELNYDLWQGPAPRRPYIDNLVHYNWHWRWHWGNGELGNNGVHTLDLCRWGLGVDFPTRVTSAGGRYHFQDDQETPDTHTVNYEFDGVGQITWEGKSCNRHGDKFIVFYGTEGTLELDSNGTHRIYDGRDKLVSETKSPSLGDIEHIVNLLDAIRNDKPLALNAEIAEGHKSTLLCHLGNIAHRVGRTLNCDKSNGHIVDDAEAMKLWQREYEQG